jgi:hypothetical protein
LDTSIPTLNIAEESIASTNIISIETVVTVSDTTAASFEYVATTVDILSTSFDSTLEPSHTYQSTNVPVMTAFETNDYENFEKGMIYMKILKKGGVVEKRGEEETKSMPHRSPWLGNSSVFYTFYLVYIWHCRM